MRPSPSGSGQDRGPVRRRASPATVEHRSRAGLPGPCQLSLLIVSTLAGGLRNVSDAVRTPGWPADAFPDRL